METKKIMFTAAVIFALLITIGSALAVLPDNLEITDIKVGKTGETLVSYDNETKLQLSSRETRLLLR